MRAFHRLDEIPVHRIPEGTLQLLSGAQSMVFWLEVDAGSHIARHSHPNEQITWLLEGRLDIQIGDDPARSCGPGSVLLIPGNTVHEAWYREKCRIVEFFSPPRLDLFPAATGNPYGLPEA